MTIDEILLRLKEMGNAKIRARYEKNGAGSNHFGVKLGDIRKLAKEIKPNQTLALQLWETEPIDAKLLSILLLKPKELSTEELDRMLGSIAFVQVADWFNAYVVKIHPDRHQLQHDWMNSGNPWVSRAGWYSLTQQIIKDANGIDLGLVLDRIEAEMGSSSPETQWTMNSALAEIGIRFPDRRSRAIAIGEKLGLYRDYPVSKGCTSPFAPIWINEMVSRQK